MTFRFRTPLAWHSLTYSKGRLAISIAGIGLAVILMSTQLGFRCAMYDSQVNLIDHLGGDLMLINRQRELIGAPEPFARRRLIQAAALDEVEAVYPFYIESGRSAWKNPDDHTIHPIRVLAFDPADLDPAGLVFDVPGLAAYREALQQPNTVLFDVKSRDYYGAPLVGTVTELGGRAVRVVGTFELGTDFLADGNLITSARNFEKLFPEPLPTASRLEKVDIGVIRLRKGGGDPAAVRAKLAKALPGDVRVLTKAGLADLERTYWAENTAIGFVFGLGMAVGFMVGMVICYQILYTNVLNDLPQFATLKAIGYTDAYLVGVVLTEAVLLSLIAFLPALVVNYYVYGAIASWTGLLMHLTVGRGALILVLTVGMCMAAGGIAVRKVLATDPAEVF